MRVEVLGFDGDLGGVFGHDLFRVGRELVRPPRDQHHLREGLGLGIADFLYTLAYLIFSLADVLCTLADVHFTLADFLCTLADLLCTLADVLTRAVQTC